MSCDRHPAQLESFHAKYFIKVTLIKNLSDHTECSRANWLVKTSLTASGESNTWSSREEMPSLRICQTNKIKKQDKILIIVQ